MRLRLHKRGRLTRELLCPRSNAYVFGQHMGEDNVVDIMSPLPQDPTKILAPKVSVTTRLLDATHMLASKLSMAKALSEQ